MKIIIVILGIVIFNTSFGQSPFISIKNKIELNKAKEKAEADGKLLYMIISAKWCGACQSLEANLKELSLDDYFKKNIVLAKTDYDKFSDSDLVWELFSGKASWSAPTNVYFVKGKEYPVMIKGAMDKSEILAKVKGLKK